MAKDSNESRSTEPVAPKRKRMPNGIPMASTLDDLFSGGAASWKKILGAAVLVPALVYGAKKKPEFLDDPTNLTIALLLASAVGVFVGCCLSIRDVVKQRLRNGQPVNFVLRLFFGYGCITIFLWTPFLIFAIAVVLKIVG